MSTRSNSFKLQRLSKTMGIRDGSPTHYQPKSAVKLPALNSVGLGVKYNDLSYITGRDLNKLRKEPEVSDDIQYESAHENLSSVRKNFDSMHKQKVARQNSIVKLKQEQENKLKITETQLLDNRENGRKKVDGMDKKLKDIKLLFSETDTQKKVLSNMRDRLKHDKVVYDQRKFNMEKELKFLKKQKEVFVIDKTGMHESDDRTNKLYKKMLAQLKEEQNERDRHIESLLTMIEQKARVNGLNLSRSMEMQEIAERAMQDKDQTQKNWQKLYLTNKFVARLLREKMEKQMNKFFTVESAFKTIKIATGVANTQTLISKFLNKESTYGNLLGKIAENEKRIDELKIESEQLQHEEKQLEAERQIIDNTKIAEVSIANEMKTLSETEKSKQRSNLLKERLRGWIAKNIKKFNLVLGQNNEIGLQRDLKTMSSNFIAYLKCVSNELDEINKSDEEINEKFEPEQKMKNEEKLHRIKKRKDSRDIEESEDEGHVNDQETDIISGQRQSIIRMNDKTMKEIKRKHQQIRKLKLQQLQANKKKEAAEPKQKAPENTE